MNLKERLLQLEAQRQSLTGRAATLEKEVALLDAELDVKNQATGILDALAEEEINLGVQTYVHLLEEGLKAIFPEQEIGQSAEVLKLRGKVSVKLKTLVKGQDGIDVEGDGLETFGGAVATIQSLLLRVALILKRGLRPLLILDETFPAVDDSRLDLLVTFLKVLCSRLNMDILCITHQAALAEHADISYKIRSTKDGAKFSRTDHHSNQMEQELDDEVRGQSSPQAQADQVPNTPKRNKKVPLKKT